MNQINKFRILCLSCLLCSCVTTVKMPGVGIEIFTGQTSRIVIKGLSDSELRIVREEMPGMQFINGNLEVGEVASAKDICIEVSRKKSPVALYKKIISVATATIYPFPYTENVSVVFSKCFKNEAKTNEVVYEVTTRFGVLNLFSPVFASSPDSTLNLASTTVLKHGIGRILSSENKIGSR